VLPTPAVAELVAFNDDIAAGAVISASHNPFQDNGIKLFGSDGFKLPDTDEAAIEAGLGVTGARPTADELGAIVGWQDGRTEYLEQLLRRLPHRLDGVDIAIDCANGATIATAHEALTQLGARVTVIADTPDGVNINVDCGSTHLELISRTVTSGGHDLGLAFDGDGDRVLAVAGDGSIVDGDQILALLALDLNARGLLPQSTVVTTSMTNLGFRHAMRAAGIEVRLTDVGDRYVLAEMRSGGYSLGGEQSGHLINLGHGPTGDGLAAGLQLLGALSRTGQTLSEAANVMTRLPQKLVNVAVAHKEGLAAAQAVWDAVADCERELGELGRVVVRPSGTEQLVRVMVEAPTEAECDLWCDQLADVTRAALGAETPA
jgi:phosphoglucosamine mutase